MKNNKKLCLAILSLLLLSGNASFAAKEKKYVLSSPDGTLKVEISAGNELAYQVMHGNDTILSHSNIGLVLENGTIVGKTPRITGERRRKIKDNIESPFYRFKEFVATGNELDLKLKGGFGIIFRAYNEGVAYRFYTTQSSDIIIKEEQAEFNFKEDYTAYLPYTTNDKKPMAMAYQNVYDITPLSKAQPKLAFLPVTVDCGSVKLTLLESDLEAYPGMFVQSQQGKYGLKGVFAPYPAKTDFYPWRKQEYVTETTDFISRSRGSRSYPWRVLAITEKDTDMPVNNLVYALASPNRIGDTSWIKTGKVAWDWWNDWNLKGVPFKAGINMDTYKYYIDFASRNGLEFIVLDEGWYDPKSGDMLTVSLSADDFAVNDTVPYLENRGVKGYFEARKLPLVVKEVKGKKAFHFEGTQVYTSSFMLPATLQDNAPYTLEAWVLNDSISENECVADFTTSHDELEKIMLVNGTEPRCGVINHYGWYEDAGYKDMKELAGKWQHIYICFDGRMEQVYVNGKLVSEKDIQLLVKPSQFITLGRNAEGDWPFTGYLHSLKLWDEYLPLKE